MGVAYFCYGLSYKKAKQFDTAIVQFVKAYQIHYYKDFSDFYKAEWQLSICYFDRGEWQRFFFI